MDNVLDRSDSGSDANESNHGGSRIISQNDSDNEGPFDDYNYPDSPPIDIDNTLPNHIKNELDDDLEFTRSERRDSSMSLDEDVEIMLPEPEMSRIPSQIEFEPRKIKREVSVKSKKEIEEEEREKMQVLVSNFTEDQLDRYEMFRRAAFPKAAVKRLMQTITGCSVSQNVVIAMSGIAKVFAGEIVEEALDVMEEQTGGEPGALQPKYLREAVRRLRNRGQIPLGRGHKQFFKLN